MKSGAVLWEAGQDNALLWLCIGFVVLLGCAVLCPPDGAEAGALPNGPLTLLAGDDTDMQAYPSALAYASIQATEAISIYLPFVSKPPFDPCTPIPGESYAAIWVYPPPTNRPAEAHADLNLALRSYRATTNYLGLIDLPGDTDPRAPQLPGLFTDNRTPTFASVYQVYDWNWACNCRGNPITNPPVTLAGFAVAPGEVIRVPSSGYSIGTELLAPPGGVSIEEEGVLSEGYEVLVLYASTERATLKYTREDNVVIGYTLHIENICVEPNLLSLYQYWNSRGRGNLPALRAGQGVGRARSAEIQVAIRDCGSFMDPRSRKDWWQGR